MTTTEKIKDIFTRKLDSVLNAPLEARLIKGLFTLGSLILGIQAFSLDFKYKDISVTAIINATSEVDWMLTALGALLVLISTFLLWKYKGSSFKNQQPSRLSELISKGTNLASDYDLQEAFRSEHRLYENTNIIRLLLSTKNPLTNVLDFKRGRCWLELKNGKLSIKNTSHLKLTGFLSTIIYFIFALAGLCFLQLTIFFSINKSTSSAIISGLFLLACSLISWLGLSTHASVEAAKRLEQSN